MSEFEIGPSTQSPGTRPEAEDAAEITVGAIVQFLLGSRTAILMLASRKQTFGLGLSLVSSPGSGPDISRPVLFHQRCLFCLPFLAMLGLWLFFFPAVEIVARHRGVSRVHNWPRSKSSSACCG